MAAEPAALPAGVLDALRDSPVGPLLDRSTEQVLAQLGIPALPQLPALPPLPGLPVLPALDPAALLQPVTDLFSGFGHGDLAATKAFDPRTVLQNITQAISTVLELATTGVHLLQSMQSAGSTAATAAAAQSAASSTALGSQATQIDAITAGAAGTVATGYLEILAVTTRFAMTTAALGPTLVTPPGQAALLSTAIEAGTEAMAITARTKAQLSGHSAQVTEAGTPVSVRRPTVSKLGGAGTHGLSSGTTPLGSAPSGATARLDAAPSSGAATAKSAATGGSSTQIIEQLVQLIQPVMTSARQIGTEITKQTSSSTTVVPAPNRDPAGHVVGLPTPAAGTGGPVTTGAVTSAAAPLGGWQAESVAAGAPGSATPPSTVVAAATTRFTAEALPPLVPGAGIPATTTERSRTEADAAVDARHLDELVDGPSGAATAPVLGSTTPSRPENPYSL